MFNFIFGNKQSLDEKVLEANKITQLNKKDITINKSSLMAITGSGKFYAGTMKGEPVSIKVKFY
jgi:hypothetical protein